LQLMHHENIFSAKGLIVDATLLTAVSDQSLTFVSLHKCNYI